jgi:hypothetical protein
MRKVTIQLYWFEELSPAAQRKALDRERENQYSRVKGMIENYIELELAQTGLKLDSLEIDFETYKTSVSISADGPQSEKQRQILNGIMAVVKEELPQLLDDKHMLANIEAEKCEFLEDGEVWLYQDKEFIK